MDGPEVVERKGEGTSPTKQLLGLPVLSECMHFRYFSPLFKTPTMPQDIATNFDAHIQQVAAKTAGMRVHRSAGLSWVDSGLPCDTFNIIFLRDSAALKAGEIAKAVQYFRSKHFPFCCWLPADQASPSILAELNSLQISQQEKAIGMALALADYQPIQQAAHWQINPVKTRQDIKGFAQIIACNWTPPDQSVLAYYQQGAHHFLSAGQASLLFTFQHQNKVVATIALSPTDTKIVGITGLSTLADYRRKGIGSALMTFALNEAKKRGYEKAVLLASELGIGIYTRYGFKAQSIFFEYG